MWVCVRERIRESQPPAHGVIKRGQSLFLMSSVAPTLERSLASTVSTLRAGERERERERERESDKKARE